MLLRFARWLHRRLCLHRARGRAAVGFDPDVVLCFHCGKVLMVEGPCYNCRCSLEPIEDKGE